LGKGSGSKSSRKTPSVLKWEWKESPSSKLAKTFKEGKEFSPGPWGTKIKRRKFPGIKIPFEFRGFLKKIV